MSLSRHGVHVDRFGAAWRQVAVDDGDGRGVSRRIRRQMAVLLAGGPEGDVLGAELVVEELLEWNGYWALISAISPLKYRQRRQVVRNVLLTFN